MKTTATIKGTHCNACKLLIEDVCKEMEGVQSCNMDLDGEEITIDHDEHFNQEIFREEIEGLGDYKLKFNQ